MINRGFFILFYSYNHPTGPLGGITQGKQRILMRLYFSTWELFVRCVSDYLDYCVQDPTKVQWFRNEVAEPVNTVTQMCTNITYQKREFITLLRS